MVKPKSAATRHAGPIRSVIPLGSSKKQLGAQSPPTKKPAAVPAGAEAEQEPRSERRTHVRGTANCACAPETNAASAVWTRKNAAREKQPVDWR
jgi:hypothetical protein